MMLLPSGRSMSSDIYSTIATATGTKAAAAAAAEATTTTTTRIATPSQSSNVTAKPLLRLARTPSPQSQSQSSINCNNNNNNGVIKAENGCAFLSTATGTAAGQASPSQEPKRLATPTYGTATKWQLNSINGGGSHYESATECVGPDTSLSLGTGVGSGAFPSITDTISDGGLDDSGNWQDVVRHLTDMQRKLQDGWTVHASQEGRLYYCNHLTQTSGWLPACEDWSKLESLPYGWERAIDSKGRAYFINHLNKTSTYEAPDVVRRDERPAEPRLVTLQRNASLGFGFVAGSERPVIVRFVTEGGPSIGKLLPGDQILAINGEDVKDAPRDHVIQLVRGCETQVNLLVSQPVYTVAPGRKSTLLSAGKRAKLRARPNRVRFAESVCVNGAPLFPPSAFSLGDICVPPMANVLKVFLENGQTKSFKYDATTTVQDVMTSLLDKLCLSSGELFSLVLEHVKSLKRNKLTLLDPEESLARIAARPGAHKLRCLFRITFVPISAADLAQKDLNALDYLFMQCCNDVTQERFAPELQPEVALRLAALHIHQHALANNFSPNKLTVKLVEREFGLERFVPTSLFEGMKRKELRRLVSHFLKLNAEMTGSSTKVLTQLQAKLHYLDIIASLPSYGAKCFSTNQREGPERVLLVSPRFGLSQISSTRNSVPQPICAIEDFTHIIVNREDDISCGVAMFLLGERAVKFLMEDRDAVEFSLVIAGYYRLLTGNLLTVVREREQLDGDNAPSYLAQHTVLPAAWSYLLPFHNRPHNITFLTTPAYCAINQAGSGASDAQNQQQNQCSYVNSSSMDLDIHSVMALELLEEAKDSGMSDSSGGGSNCCEHTQSEKRETEDKNQQVMRRVHEMQQMVENSEQYLNEQDEPLQELPICGKLNGNGIGNVKLVAAAGHTVGVVEFDSDCDSLNSSKLSSNEEAAQTLAAMKHSDSLTLLAETINHDLSGIAQSLNSMSQAPKPIKPSLCTTSSPRPPRKVNGFSQLLNDLQSLGTDFSQSESDSESVASPAQSPVARRPSGLITNGEASTRKANAAYRCSFGLHSPDGNNFGTETKDYNLKEYLKQLKEISNSVDAQSAGQDTDLAAKKLSEIYGFEIREDTFIETDADLIDLRAIPPPKTPDELDSLSLLNAPPQGFDDVELDRFLEKVVVAPPTVRTAPAKELTPEEIMSYIIPPPPNLDDIQQPEMSKECLYSNSVQAKRAYFDRISDAAAAACNGEDQTHVIEYATVERRSKFSCCPTSKTSKEQAEMGSKAEVKPPTPQSPPARPPKSAELVQRTSPKKQVRILADKPQPAPRDMRPPQLPPRTSPTDGSEPPVSSYAPKKPPLPPMISRPPMLRGLTGPNTASFNGTQALRSPSARLVSSQPPPVSPQTHAARMALLCSPQLQRKLPPVAPKKPTTLVDKRLIIKNGHGHIIDGEALLAKTDIAMAGLLIKLDHVAAQCTAAQAAGGGASIDEEKFQQARSELTEQTLALVTASKFLVAAMSDLTLTSLPEHLTSCLTAIRRITELTQDITRHNSAPLQTRNIVLKVHDVASSFRELVGVQMGPLGAGQLALQAECLANVLATLLRSLRVFSP